MKNAGNSSLIKSSPFDAEDIKCLKLILEIEKISRFLKQFYIAPGLTNSTEDLGPLTYSIEHALKASKEQEGKACGSFLN